MNPCLTLTDKINEINVVISDIDFNRVKTPVHKIIRDVHTSVETLSIVTVSLQNLTLMYVPYTLRMGPSILILFTTGVSFLGFH